jgi:hypothetical protein
MWPSAICINSRSSMNTKFLTWCSSIVTCWSIILVPSLSKVTLESVSSPHSNWSPLYIAHIREACVTHAAPVVQITVNATSSLATSVKQWQILALAHVIVCNSQLLILDEGVRFLPPHLLLGLIFFCNRRSQPWSQPCRRLVTSFHLSYWRWCWHSSCIT